MDKTNTHCEVCGQPLIKKSQTRFCSKKCYGVTMKRDNNATCEFCGKEFRRPLAWLKKSVHHLCSIECRAAHKSKAMKGVAQPQLVPTAEGRKRGGEKMRGENNPSWKGGATLRKRKGNYTVSVKYVRCPIEFISMARKDGYVMEHRLVMAQHIGRPLLRTEVVHHIDHNPLNNAIENLQLFASNAEHKRHEGLMGYFKGYFHRTRTNRQNSD